MVSMVITRTARSGTTLSNPASRPTSPLKKRCSVVPPWATPIFERLSTLHVGHRGPTLLLQQAATPTGAAAAYVDSDFAKDNDTALVNLIAIANTT